MALTLGINEPYRQALEMAQQLTGIGASALAAVIDAEAAKIASGPSKGLWNKDSFNSTSKAAGLTQFLESTWIGHAQAPSHLLNARAREIGFVNEANKVIPSRKADLLKLRFDPVLSIVSAAEYGVDNLKSLSFAGVLPGGLTDDSRARFIYLAHHEGAGGAVGFLRGTRVYSRDDLIGQVGITPADDFISRAGGDASAAYRLWLEEYMDRKIVPAKFRDGPETATPLPAHLGVPFQGQFSAGSDLVPSGAAYVTTESLNLRATPDGAILQALTLGDVVTVIGRIGDTRWYNVKVDSKDGVVSGAYLRQPLSTAKETLFAGVIAEWVRFKKGKSSEEVEPYDGYVHEMWQAIEEVHWGHSVYADGSDVPWSAAFISWVVRNGGYQYRNFKFDASHSVFSNDAILARVMEQANKPFWAYRPTERRPEIGDIIHRNRLTGGSYTYDFAENHTSYSSHSDVVVEVRNQVTRVIGGNTGTGEGTVALSEYGLDANGYLLPGQRIIALLKNRADLVPQ